MKKQILNTVKKTVVNFGFAFLFVLNNIPAQAQDKVRTGIPPADIKYLGKVNNQPLLLIDFDNVNEQTIYLSITDEYGNVLYTEKIKDRKFSKKFQWQTSEMDNAKLKFTLTSEKEKQFQVFEVNSNMRMVQDVVITKL